LKTLGDAWVELVSLKDHCMQQVLGKVKLSEKQGIVLRWEYIVYRISRLDELASDALGGEYHLSSYIGEVGEESRLADDFRTRMDPQLRATTDPEMILQSPYDLAKGSYSPLAQVNSVDCCKEIPSNLIQW